MFNIFKKFDFFRKNISNELFEINEIKECASTLGNWQMIPLSAIINNNKVLIVKYTNEHQYNKFKKNPWIETIPYFIEIKSDDSYAYMCYLFVKIYDSNNETYTIHETVFDLKTDFGIEDCKRAICSPNNSIILVTNNKAHLIDYTVAYDVCIGRKVIIDTLVEKSNNKKSLDFLSTVKRIQSISDDAEELLAFFKEDDEYSSLLSLEVY